MSKISNLIEVIINAGLSVLNWVTFNGKEPKEDKKAAPKKPKPIIPKEPDIVYKIGLSPGHGGTNFGAISPTGQKECHLARLVCAEMELAFRNNRAFDVVVHDPGEDKPKDYQQRVLDSDARSEDYYIPIHFNAWDPKPKKNGWLVFVDPNDVKADPQVKKVAMSVINSLDTFRNIGYGDWTDESGDSTKDGYMEGIGRKVYENTQPDADTIYLELGYISNPAWDAALKKPEFIKEMAIAVVTGFENVLNVREFRNEQ